MGGWTGIGKDRINWNGQIEQRDLIPSKNNDLVVKKYVDDAVAGGGGGGITNLDGGKSDANFGGVAISPIDGGDST